MFFIDDGSFPLPEEILNLVRDGKAYALTVSGLSASERAALCTKFAGTENVYLLDPATGLNKAELIHIPVKTISVLIPMYLAGGYIKEAVKSVYMQQADAEVIIVDDGSADDSAEQARQSIINAPIPTYLLRMPHRGQAASRNTALAYASGKWIFYLDADDVLTNGALAALLQEAKDEQAVCSLCRDFISPELTEEEASHLQINPEPYRRKLAGCLLISREVYEQVGKYDERLPSSETAQWMLRMNDAGVTIKDIDYITLLRRYHRNNFGRRSRKTQLESYMAIIRQRRSQGAK
ncbi:MAG: glycosyltransferase family 2 protein [Solobacterium sp.]|nr:glycosyltransferase family 2 protein [Solobacterium sp.]